MIIASRKANKFIWKSWISTSRVVFWTKNQKESGETHNESYLKIFDTIMKDYELMKEEYFTSDSPPTVEEIHQEGLRSVYLGRYALYQTINKIDAFTNTFDKDFEKLQLLKGIEEKSLEAFGKILPENKVRPSTLHPLWHAIGLIGAFSSIALGEERSMKMMKTVEDVIQFEHDEFLRRLNDNKISDQPTRQILIKTRDAGYDYFKDNYNDNLETQKDDEIDKFLKTATKYTTIGLMQLAKIF